MKTTDPEIVEIEKITPPVNNKKRSREKDGFEDLSNMLMTFTDDIPDNSMKDPRLRQKRKIEPTRTSLMLTSGYEPPTPVLPPPKENPKHRFYKVKKHDVRIELGKA